MEDFVSPEAAQEAERRAIQCEGPLHNVARPAPTPTPARSTLQFAEVPRLTIGHHFQIGERILVLLDLEVVRVEASAYEVERHHYAEPCAATRIVD